MVLYFSVVIEHWTEEPDEMVVNAVGRNGMVTLLFCLPWVGGDRRWARCFGSQL